jgi:MFS family permease
MQCAWCSTVQRDGAKFCAQCGKVLGERVCPQCWAVMRAKARFCEQGGMELGEAVVGVSGHAVPSGVAGRCPHCGVSVGGGTPFCPACGGDLREGEATWGAKRRRGRRRWIGGIGVGALMAMVLGGVVFIWGDRLRTFLTPGRPGQVNAIVRASWPSSFLRVLFKPQKPHRAKRPPAVYIDKGCPGEGCSYAGRVKVLKRTPVYVFPSVKSARLFELVPGEIVTALDSEVHTVAGRFVVKRPHGRYRPGDVLWVYTYLGEGFFKVWYHGKMYEEDLGFSPWGGTSGKRCEKDEYCWGELEKELEMKWWLKVKDKKGRKGWVIVVVGVDSLWDGNLAWEDEDW